MPEEYFWMLLYIRHKDFSMEGIVQKLIHSKSKTFLAFCFCFLFGVLVFSFFNEKIFPVYINVLAFLSIGFVFLFWKEKLIRFICFCLFFFLLGLVRVNLAFPSSDPENLRFYNGQKTQMHGIITAEPDIRQDSIHYLVAVNKIYFSGQWKEVKGKVAFTMPLYPRYSYGQNIELNCALETPEPFEDFRYEKYLATYNVWSLCKSPALKLIPGNSGNPLLNFIYTLKYPVAEKINLLWHEPYASFVAGLLYGYRGGLGSLNEDFNRTGVTHIVAVSGFNITLIATIISSFLIYLCVPRRKAFWIVVGGILLFVIFTGASASVVRAGIMGIIALLARQLGRPAQMQNVLALTVAVMTFQNPFILVWDVGFQLSFLSTCGLIYLSPVIKKYFEKVPEFLNLRESLLSTMSAIIFTLPLILFQFGRLSVVAPIVNLLILPAIPWLMALGFVSVVAGFILFPLARIIAYITYLGLAYVVQVVRFFSHLPFAALDFHLPLWGMLALYGLLIFVLYKNHIKSLEKFENKSGIL